MNTTLAVYQPKDLKEIGLISERFAQSGMFKDTRDYAQAFVKIMAGGAMGFDPFASMTGIHIISGKPTMGAGLIAAAVQRHPDFDYDVTEHTDKKCVIKFMKRRDGEWMEAGVSTFTMDDAKAAQLLSNQTWQKYPRNMLYARAMSNGARWYCAGIFGGSIYTPEEMGAPVDEDGDIVEGVIVENVSAPVEEVAQVEKPARQKPQQQPAQAADPLQQEAAALGGVPAEQGDNSGKPANDWVADDTKRAGFWVHANKLEIEHEQVHAILQVTSLKEYTGTLGDAKMALKTWRDANPKAA